MEPPTTVSFCHDLSKLKFLKHSLYTVLVDALLRGVEDGMDILTISMGGTGGWSSSSSALVADRISQQGKIVTIAAGNDGASGPWYTSSYASAAGVIAIGSVDK